MSVNSVVLFAVLLVWFLYADFYLNFFTLIYCRTDYYTYICIGGNIATTTEIFNIMSIFKSIMWLAKYNNGLFKSEKQAKFLISKIDRRSGCIGHASSGFYSCPIMAHYDDKGITKLVKVTKNGNVLTFERKKEGVLTSLEIKEIKWLERRRKSIQKEIEEREIAFNSGNYNRSGDTSTYTKDEIEMYEYFQAQKRTQVLNIDKKIKSINNG